MCGQLLAQKVLYFKPYYIEKAKNNEHHEMHKWPGPSCSKLTTSLVNDLLKFTLSDTQIC